MLDRRQLLLGAASGAVLAAGGAARAAPPSAADVSALYKRAFVFDMLGSLGNSGEDRRYDGAELVPLVESGLTAIHTTVGVEDWDDTVQGMTRLRLEFARQSKRLLLAERHADLALARRTRRLAVIFGVQGSLLLGRDLDRVNTLHQLGLRIFQLTYNRADLVGDGCLEPRDGGLTTFGRELVARLDERRIAVDLSHCGRRTSLEAIRTSTRPVLVTHTGCAAVFAHPRNKDDATLRAVADRGGAVGIYLMPFLGRPADGGASTAAMALDHIEHALKVCGEDHVGIGTDGEIPARNDTPEEAKEEADYIALRKRLGISAPEEDRPLYVPELNMPRRYEAIALGLARRGHPLRVIEKVLGLGFHRALGRIWA